MPLRGEKHSDLVLDEVSYFTSLSQLDDWFSQPHDKLCGVIPYHARPYLDDQSGGKPRLLICHDYKGGYQEFPSGLCYTFNFWSYCDTFVYFSHHRVTIPPSGWTNAAHRQGARMLGTLIFEGDSSSEYVQLIYGRGDYAIKDNKVPISERYAVYLADLALQRGFDGYLLNFESNLSSGANEARAVAAWILILRAELRARVGSHAQVIWYDSVIYDGWIQYQNRLDGYNLPFFLAADGLFTNYWWGPDTQRSMVQYFQSLQPTPSSSPPKTLQDIYTGIDVYGRGQYGGGGYCCYRSLTYTSPLGLSTALFAPGWTWESATSHAEQNWDDWWKNERKLWVGPLKPDDTISCGSEEGPFKPITAFFRSLSPPNPSDFAFYTNFSPGVGYSWYVQGTMVLDTKVGWTDIDKQGSIGNLVWPRPTPSWIDVRRTEPPPVGLSTLDMTDGYNGGNTLKLAFNYSGQQSDTSVRTIWLPVQSITVTSNEWFEVHVVYKLSPGIGDVDARISARSIFTINQPTVSNTTVSDEAIISEKPVVSILPQGWIHQSTKFRYPSNRDTIPVYIGFVISFKPATVVGSKHYIAAFSLSLGQLVVYPSPDSKSVSVGTPSIQEPKFAPIRDGAVEGALTWDTKSTFTPADIHVDSPESTTPAWLLQDTPAYRFPTFVYFNVYAEPNSDHMDPANAVFIGTTGLDGRGNRFYVEPTTFPDEWGKRPSVRFYIQGVTDRGEVLPWEDCATVDS